MEQHGNTTTFNLENVLYQNIQTSLYYRETCDKLTTWEHCVDEMYENVDHVEPWMSGNARGPSTAFCLVYRLGELKPTVKQVKDLIDHSDSPYIRAVCEGKPTCGDPCDGAAWVDFDLVSGLQSYTCLHDR